jgi:serine/threonine protein kinase
MLSGVPPFYSSDTLKLFDQIKNCDYDFEVKYWYHVSDEAKDFISKILVSDPKRRMNPEEMLAHPWMKS